MHFLGVTFQTLMNVFCFSKFKIKGSGMWLEVLLIKEERQASQGPAPLSVSGMWTHAHTHTQLQIKNGSLREKLNLEQWREDHFPRQNIIIQY